MSGRTIIPGQRSRPGIRGSIFAKLALASVAFVNVVGAQARPFAPPAENAPVKQPSSPDAAALNAQVEASSRQGREGHAAAMQEYRDELERSRQALSDFEKRRLEYELELRAAREARSRYELEEARKKARSSWWR